MRNRKWTRKLLAAVLAALMALSALGSSLALAEEQTALSALDEGYVFGLTEASVEKQVFPYIKDFSEEEVDRSGEVALYFVEGGDIPYVALSEYMPLLSEALERYVGRPGIVYEVLNIGEHLYVVKRNDVESFMMVDTSANTIYFENFNAFTQLASVTASVSLLDLPEPKQGGLEVLLDMIAAMAGASEEEQQAMPREQQEGEQGTQEENLFVSGGASYNRSGRSIDLNLSDYMIDIVEQAGECYVPMQTLNDLFMNVNYLQYVFNGKALYGFCYESKIAEELFQAEPQEMSQDFALFNYNALRLMLDCSYGLKPEHDIVSFGEMLNQIPGMVSDLTSTDPKRFDDAIMRLTMTHFDDLHSHYDSDSWRSGKSNVPLQMRQMMAFGFSSNLMVGSTTSSGDARSAAFPDGLPMYQEVGDTAFVTFDSFVATKPSDYYHEQAPDPETFFMSFEAAEKSPEEAILDIAEMLGIDTSDGQDGEAETPSEPKAEPKEIDTIWLIKYAHEQITREGSPIKNVVLDLSNNGGGESNAAVFVIAWVLGQADIALRNTFTGAQTIMRVNADLNFDNTYLSERDGLIPRGYRVFCLTNSNSFSCGNLVPAALKMSEKVTIVGQTSGGGSCVVLPCTSASGTLFTISGPQQLSIVHNGAYYNIDQGIEPDIPLINAESFYDREGLVEYLGSLK